MYFLITFFGYLILGFLVGCQSPQKSPQSVRPQENLVIQEMPLVKILSSEKEEDHVARAAKSMVVSQGPGSTHAGVDVLKKGGNVVDAAIAVSFAISVERPQSTGIGGGGFLLFYDPKKKKVHAFDFRETAPKAITPEMFLDPTENPDQLKSQIGGLAVATPGMVEGLYRIHSRFGKMPWSTLLAPAIKMAEEGFLVYDDLANALGMFEKSLSQFPSTKSVFFNKQENRVWKKGELFIQKDLAKTLKKIAKQGPKAFYRGEIAKKMVNSVDEYGGVLSLKDLKNYRSKDRTPIKGSFQGLDVYSMPPPSSGGIHVVQILNLVESFELNKLKNEKPWETKNIHYTVASMQQAFADRAAHLGDPDFVSIPVKELTSKSYAREVKNTIQENKFKSPKEVMAWGQEKKSLPKKDSPETTHFTIMDSSGYVVTSTQTINGGFGSQIVAEGTGILLNNEIDDFGIKVGTSNMFGAIGGEKNLVGSLKRPLSSMSPTIVIKNDRPILALGSPNGTRIINCVTETILNYTLYGLSLRDSVYLMRYHQQWLPNELWLEEGPFNMKTIEELKAKQHNLIRKDFPCRVQGVALDQQDENHSQDSLTGVSDPRGRGLALGL
ncbi:MAG: gamma-glutamyltransferase [Bacteriovoracaceae bacterium]|nr:gamma-glutamyltransferase [Bacteriovoracaceae bacterium]